MRRFLVWRNATEWPKNIEDGFSPEAPQTLPQAVFKALSAHKADLPGTVREWREGGGEIGACVVVMMICMHWTDTSPRALITRR